MQFINKLPRQLSREALVLMRRLSYLEALTKDSHSETEVLSDVGDMQDFIYHYFNSYDMTVSKFVLTYERYQLETLMEDNDDSRQVCSEEDD